jgi:hypothetical protein
MRKTRFTEERMVTMLRKDDQRPVAKKHDVRAATIYAHRRRYDRLTTHCRIAASGSTWSMSWAARSAMRRPPQLGQKPRPLHENGTRRSWLQASE